MLYVKPLKIVPQSPVFSHEEACHVYTVALSRRDAQKVVVDLGEAREATTSAFAQLVLLRRLLLRSGRDLLVTGLRDRAAGLFEVNRLAGVLPSAN